MAGGTPYIQYKYMYYKIYKFPNPVHAKRTETPYLTYTPQYISNTKIYIKVTIFPNDWQFTSYTNICIYSTYKYSQSVGRIDPIQIYLLQNVHSPNLPPPTGMHPLIVCRLYPKHVELVFPNIAVYFNDALFVLIENCFCTK